MITARRQRFQRWFPVLLIIGVLVILTWLINLDIQREWARTLEGMDEGEPVKTPYFASPPD